MSRSTGIISGRPGWRRHAFLAAVCSAEMLLAAGCGREGGAVSEEPVADSVAARYDGLSRDQIRERAEPMSPARAESLGIIDSTIYIEDLEERLDTVAAEDTLDLPRPAGQ